jgi:hypothetical protein
MITFGFFLCRYGLAFVYFYFLNKSYRSLSLDWLIESEERNTWHHSPAFMKEERESDGERERSRHSLYKKRNWSLMFSPIMELAEKQQKGFISKKYSNEWWRYKVSNVFAIHCHHQRKFLFMRFSNISFCVWCSRHLEIK